DETVLAPIAAADDVARARRRDARAGIAREVRAAVRGGDELGARLRARVRVVSTEGVVLDEAPARGALAVRVALVGGHDDDREDALARAANCVEHVDGAEHVDEIGVRGLCYRSADER